MFSSSVCAFFCVCVQVEALRRSDHPPKKSYRLSMIQKKTEVKRREAHWGCSANEKKLSSFSLHEFTIPLGLGSRDSLIGLQAGRPGFDSRQGQEFSLFIASRPDLCPRLIQMVPWAFSPGVKRPEYEPGPLTFI
jgi:hypothetical protein